MFDVLLKGDKALARKLDRMGRQAGRRVMRPAVSKALTPINKAAKRKCPEDKKLLKKSIGKRVKLARRGDSVWGGVGPRKGTEGNRGVMVHLVEYGTVHSAAKPFLRPALDENRGAAMRILADSVRAGIEKEARRP